MLVHAKQRSTKKRIAAILYAIYFFVLTFSVLTIVRLFLLSSTPTKFLDTALLDVATSAVLTVNHLLPAMNSNHSHTRVCPCCGYVGEKFAGNMNGIERVCPVCRSRERHRKFCAILHCPPSRGGLSWESGAQPFRLLHFGPQKSMYQLINSLDPPVEQIGLDYFAPGYSYDETIVSHGDVTNLSFEDETTDGIVILHVLEYIRELDKAVSEMRRVLKSTGWIYIEVPCFSSKDSRTVDCRKYTTEADLTKCAGQFDHVWRFDCSDFLSVLSEHNLSCTQSQELDAQKECLPLELRRRMKVKHPVPNSFPSFLCRRSIVAV